MVQLTAVSPWFAYVNVTCLLICDLNKNLFRDFKSKELLFDLFSLEVRLNGQRKRATCHVAKRFD